MSAPLVESTPSNLDLDPDAILAAEDLVRDFCGWPVARSTTETVTVDGTGTSTVLLPSLYVTAVNSVITDGVTLAAAYYSWSTNGVLEKLYGCWPAKRRSVQANITHGYLDCPPAVRRVVAVLASAAYATMPDLSDELIAQLRPYELKSL